MFPTFKITLKNYRCFPDSTPATIMIGPGFTALVGANNAGKSSLLRSIYELRSLWTMALGNFPGMAIGQKHGATFIDVRDQAEVFHNANERALSVTIEIVNPTRAHNLPELIRLELETPLPEHPWSANLHWDDKNFTLPANVNRVTKGILYQGQLSVADCEGMNSVLQALAQCLYIGPFRSAISKASAAYYDLKIGTDFIKEWDHWKTGPNKQQNIATGKVTEDIRLIFSLDRLEISAANSKDTLHVEIDSRPYKLEELGAGIAQFIVVLTNVAIREPSFVLIDEPELNLHPSLQIDFLLSLASYAKHGVIFATHSIGLARSSAENIHSIQRKTVGVEVRPFNQTPNYAEFLGELGFSGFKELGFDKILLVEGVTDVKTIQQFLRLYKKDHKIIVLPLGGDALVRGGMQQELSELTRISPNIHALVDSERPAEGAPAIQNRLDFEGDCNALGIGVHLTHFRATEHYLVDSAVKAAKGPQYRALGPYEDFKALSPKWSKSDNWRIAHHMKLADIENTDVGIFIDSL